MKVNDTQPNLSLTITADISDNITVDTASLYFRATGSTAYTQRNMVNTTGDRWSATLESSLLTDPGIEYCISATDGRSTTFCARPEQPYSIAVENRPVVTGVTPALGPASRGDSCDCERH